MHPIKTLDEIDHAYSLIDPYEISSQQHNEYAEAVMAADQKQGWIPRLFGILFYVTLAFILVMLFVLFGDSTGAPRSLGGFSMMRVLTPSMQNVIPKDSLIITQEVNPQTLEVGDDITFLRDENNTTVTHRIVEIRENYVSSGKRGFQTQGTMNSGPDKDIVSADNVIGKVIFHNLTLGQAMGFIKEYALWIGLFSALLIGLFVALRVALGKDHIQPHTKKSRGKEVEHHAQSP
jgi:signal peptidase I